MLSVRIPTQAKLLATAILRRTQRVYVEDGTDMHDGVYMKRNWGIPKVTTRSASGDQRPSGPLHGANTTHADNVISLADHFPSRGDRLNSERLTVAPSFIREFAAWMFVILYVNIPGIFVLAAVTFYALMIAQPVED